MTTGSYIIILFAIFGILVGQLMLITSDKIVREKCADKNQEEPWRLFNQLIRGKTARVIISIINGIAWAMIANFGNNIISMISISIIFSIAVMISFIDIRIRIIPNKLVLALVMAGTVYQISNFGAKSLLIAAGCMIIIMALFLVLGAVMGMEKIGAGDVKLAGAMGLVLGYPNILLGILLMAIVILIYCFIGFSMYKMSLKSMFAYAPFMMSGMIIAMAVMILDINIFAASNF